MNPDLNQSEKQLVKLRLFLTPEQTKKLEEFVHWGLGVTYAIAIETGKKLESVVNCEKNHQAISRAKGITKE